MPVLVSCGLHNAVFDDGISLTVKSMLDSGAKYLSFLPFSQLEVGIQRGGVTHGRRPVPQVNTELPTDQMPLRL